MFERLRRRPPPLLATRRAGPVEGFIGGVAAGGAMLAVELGARVLFDTPTLPELAQDRLVLALPGPLFAFMLEHLLYLGKPALFSALLCLELLIAGLAGIVAGRWRGPIEVALALWLVTGLLLLPFVEQGLFAGDVAEALTLLLASAAYAGVLLWLWWPARTAAPTPPPSVGSRVLARRELLGGIGFLALSALLARLAIGNLPRLPSRKGTLPDPITSPANFYVVSKNLLDPEVDGSGWQLRIDGMVDHPLTLTLADIRALPAQDVVRTLECISNEVGGGLISNGRWTGVRLADLLQSAGVQSSATTLHFTSTDNYSENMALAKAMNADTLLAYELDGAPLPSKHGFPLRVLSTGTYGMRNPKWLTHIELTDVGASGYWEQQGWLSSAMVQTMSRIDSPAEGGVAEDAPVQVGGIAFAGDRGIQAVEIAIDGGGWEAADLEPALGSFTWVLWTKSAQFAGGHHSIEVRATDGTGAVQTAAEADTYPSGATGYDRIIVEAG